MIHELRAERTTKTYLTREFALQSTRRTLEKIMGADAAVQIMCCVTEDGRYFCVTRLMRDEDLVLAAAIASRGYMVIN